VRITIVKSGEVRGVVEGVVEAATHSSLLIRTGKGYYVLLHLNDEDKIEVLENGKFRQ